MAGTKPGAKRVDLFLLSEWRFLGQSLGNRKESSNVPNQAGVQRWGSSRVAPCREVDATGGYPLLTLLEILKALPAEQCRKCISSYS